MPVIRYFLLAGGSLLALLFVADATLPKEPEAPVMAKTAVSAPIVRIHSERKWPDKLVYDTSAPATLEAMAGTGVAEVDSAEIARSTQNSSAAPAREAYAELRTSDMQTVPKPKAARNLATRRARIAVAKKPQPVLLAAQRPQFGFIPNTTW